MSEPTIWACRACRRMGDSPTDLLRQGCEGTHEEFVPAAEVAALRAKLDRAEQYGTDADAEIAGLMAQVAALRADLNAIRKALGEALREHYRTGDYTVFGIAVHDFMLASGIPAVPSEKEAP